MTHQTDHESTADKAAVTPPPALTTEGRLRARVQTLEEDAERNQGLAKVGARCMREGHQGLIESGRATVEGHRFALSVKLGLGTDATWDAIHERVKELRVDSAAPAAVSAAVAPPTNQTALRDRIADALVTTRRTDYEGKADHRQHRYDARCALCAADVDALADAVLAVLPEPVDRAAVLREAADAVFALDYDVMVGEEGDENLGSMREAWDVGTIHASQLLRRMADETATETPAPDDRNAGPGWYEVITSPQATTCIAYVHEDGSLYLPEGDLTEEEFAFAAARGKAHRLVRADEQPAAGVRQDGAET